MLVCQRLRRAGFFEQRSVNLERFGFDSLAKALQCDDPNSVAFLLGFSHAKILQWVRHRLGQRLNPLAVGGFLDWGDQYLFVVPAALSFDPIADNTLKP